MGTLVAGGALLGAILGRSFKVLVLVPASAVAIAVLLLRHAFDCQSGRDFAVGLGFLITSLELGYVTGMLSKDLRGLVEGLEKSLRRSRQTL